MNSKPYDDLPVEMADKLADIFPLQPTGQLETKLHGMLKDKLKARMEELSESGDLTRLSSEEVDLLTEFRKFKSTAKNGSVFKWQTRQAEQLIVIPSEETLIAHPQNMSDGAEGQL